MLWCYLMLLLRSNSNSTESEVPKKLWEADSMWFNWSTINYSKVSKWISNSKRVASIYLVFLFLLLVTQ